MSTTDHVIRVLPAEASQLTRTIEHEVDDRWLLAFAASIKDTRPEVFDVERTSGLVGHPVFPVCIEWPLIEHGAPGIELSTSTLRLGLHVSHHIQIHAQIRPGQRLRTIAAPYLAEPRTNASLIATTFNTYSDAGELLVTSFVYTLYPRVRLLGIRPAPAHAHSFAEKPGIDLTPIEKFSVAASDAILYTECARIWNPIHTDIRVARAAGLPDTVLHGTATLARAVTAVCRSEYTHDNPMITQVGCHFAGQVFPGTSLTVNAAPRTEGTISFEVRTDTGTSVISDGLIAFTTTP